MKFLFNMTKYKGKIKAPNIVRGGAAIPLGNNFYYMAGRKHEAGGIDIGNDLEVEGDEVMQMRNNDVRVFSAQPILNGYSPAELIIRGYDANDVFNAQERFKDINRIKDDGSRYKCGGKNNMNKRKRNGGIVSINGNVKDGLVYWASPSTGERKKAPMGSRLIGIDRAMAILNQSNNYNKQRTDKIIEQNNQSIENNNTNNTNNTDNNSDTNFILNPISGTIGGLGIAYLIGQQLYNKNSTVRKNINNITKNIKDTYSNAIKKSKNAFIQTEFDENAVKKYTNDRIDENKNKTKNVGNSNRRKNAGYTANFDEQRTRYNFDERNTNIRYSDTQAGNTRIRERMNGVRLRGGSPTSEIESRRFNKLYDRITGKVEPASGFGRRPVQTEIYITPKTNPILESPINIVGDSYDARSEFNNPPRNTKKVNNSRLRPKGKVIGNLANKLGVLGNSGIVGDLIRSYFSTPEDDKQQRLNLYYQTGDISFLKDGDLVDNNLLKYGGSRKKAQIGTQSNNRTLSMPIFSLFGPRYDRVLEIDYGNNGNVNSYNGIMRDLNNPNAGFNESLNNGYYNMGIDYFNNRRYPINISNVENSNEQTVTPQSSISTPRRSIVGNTTPTSTTTPTSVLRFTLSIPNLIAESIAKENNSLVANKEFNKLKNINTISTQTPAQISVKTSTETSAKNIDDGHYAGEFNSITPTDWIGLASNLSGSIGSWLAGRNTPTLNYSEPTRPIMEQPVRMVTNYNNRPQISNVEQSVRRSMRDITSNTSSSRAALQRMQRIRNAGTQNINELEAERENIETTLRNADASNRQRVRARNTTAYNDYLEQRNRIRNLEQSVNYEGDVRRIDNNVGLFNNLNISIQDMLNNINQRNNFNNTLGYLRGASPNVDDRIFRDMGVIFSRMFNTNR